MDGLRCFIEVDNRRAVEVGQLRRGTRSVTVEKPRFSEDCPEASIREKPEELTLRAEEVGALNACKNIDHIEADRWAPASGGCSLSSNLQNN